VGFQEVEWEDFGGSEPVDSSSVDSLLYFSASLYVDTPRQRGFFFY
jgi:hypothetical protein